MRYGSRGLSIVLLLVAACGVGCKPHHKPPPPPCTAPPLDPDRSLVVHDPAALATAFPLRRTLQQIIDTSGNPATTPEALLATLLTSLTATSFVQPVSGRTIPVDPRPAEAGLSVPDLLNPSSSIGMIPIGLFNRFDLAPDDGSNCGEYRIVYARRNPPPTSRFLMIFEARLPNPNLASGLAGCQPITKFWADLSTQPAPAQRIAALETFYYAGLPSTSFGPVVTHANYGMPFGQVRTNLFMQFPWLLREHRTSLDPGTAVPIFKVDTVKETPLTEWFRDPSTLPSGVTPADQQTFRAQFLNTSACNLLRPDRANPAATDFDVVNGIGGQFEPAGNEFQSVSLGDSDDPTNLTDPAFTSAAGTRLAQLSVATVTPEQLFNRSGAMTCGGCHEFSASKPLGGGHTWPASAGFVHITEDGTLSQALTGFLLPRRGQILTRFYCNPTTEPQLPVPCPAPAMLRAPSPPTRRAAAPAALPSAEGLEPAVVQQLTRGRTAPSLQQVDAARLAVLAAARRAKAAPRALRATATSEGKRAAAILEEAVQRARAEEQALPGAFVSVRRVH